MSHSGSGKRVRLPECLRRASWMWRKESKTITSPLWPAYCFPGQQLRLRWFYSLFSVASFLSFLQAAWALGQECRCCEEGGGNWRRLPFVFICGTKRLLRGEFTDFRASIPYSGVCFKRWTTGLQALLASDAAHLKNGAWSSKQPQMPHVAPE